MPFLTNTSQTCIFQTGGLHLKSVVELKNSEMELLEESRNGLFYPYLIVNRRKKGLLSNQTYF